MKKLDNTYVGTRTFRPYRIGAGGYFTEVVYGTDGTCAASTDVQNGYIWRTTGQADAEPLFTPAKLPANWKTLTAFDGENNMGTPGVFSVDIFKGDPNKLLANWRGRVWRTDNKSTTWRCCTALPQMFMDANGSGRS